MALTRWVGRAIGLDVHRDFCVVAICEDGEVRSAGRVASTPEGLSVLAESLVRSDRVALEVTGSCWEVARILEPHVDRVVVVSPDDINHHVTDRPHGRIADRDKPGRPRAPQPRPRPTARASVPDGPTIHTTISRLDAEGRHR